MRRSPAFALIAAPALARRGALLVLTLLCACRAPGRDRDQAGATRAAAPAPREALACTLITIPELQRITGWSEVARGPVNEDYMGYSRCDWRHGGPAFALALVVNDQGKFEDYRTVPGAIPVSGLGEAAVWNPRTRQLGVRVSPGTISVNFLGEVTIRRQWAEEIARTVVRALNASRKATTPPPATTSAAGAGASSGTAQ